ncbi:MAG: YhcH/YjgK/YiaL family protein, partial [Kiritimatiellae bacterium]|nr:YhcH/YjgK/YiaL family protein [Kiritimatiellia bacterium]
MRIGVIELRMGSEGLPANLREGERRAFLPRVAGALITKNERRAVGVHPFGASAGAGLESGTGGGIPQGWRKQHENRILFLRTFYFPRLLYLQCGLRKAGRSGGGLRRGHKGARLAVIDGAKGGGHEEKACLVGLSGRYPSAVSERGLGWREIIVMKKAGILLTAVSVTCCLNAGRDGLFCQCAPYVIGRIADTAAIEKLNPHFHTACEFLRKTDLTSLKDGKLEIDGDNVFAYVSTVELAPIDADGEYESHRQYIDIHVPITEEETIGTYTLTEREIALPFGEKEDYVLFKARGFSVTVKPNEFAVFFPPYGGHRPGCTAQKTSVKNHRKLCVKVKAGFALKNMTRVYENPIPNLRSRQAIFPNLCELPDGRLLCCFVLAEAFEAADMRSYLAESTDGGKTWSEPWRMFKEGAVPESETCKCTALGGNRVMAIGYAAERRDRDGQLANAQTGGLLPHRVFCAFSEDSGRTWSEKKTIPEAWHAQTEVSAPAVRLKDGALAAPITGFPNWVGKMTS